MAETVQPMVQQLISHGISTIDTLNENDGIWIPATSAIRRTPDITHWSAIGHVVGQGTVFVESVGDYIEENYKNYFEIARGNSKLQSERNNIETSRPPLDSNSAGAKTSDAKTPATDSNIISVKTSNPKKPETYSSARKEKARK